MREEREELNESEMRDLENKLLHRKEEDTGEGNAISSKGGGRGGVLQQAMSSIDDNKDYRQELKTGFFTSPRKQMQMVLAIDEMRECGIDPTLVIDLLIAQKAGEKGGLLHDIFQALTHSTFTTNYTGKGKHFWQSPDKSQPGE